MASVTGPGTKEYLLRRRRRSIDLRLARRRDRQYSKVREGLSWCEGRSPRTKLSFDPQILAAASGLIANNEGRLGKTLWTEAKQGEKLTVRGVWDGEAEARVVGEEVEALHTNGTSLDEIAVLVRAGFQTREFEERFITLGVPYRVVGGPRFYEREEIRDAIAYFRVVRQPDDDLAFERIINKPTRGIGKATLQVLHEIARATRRPLFASALDVLSTDELRPQAKRTLATIIDDFERWRRLSEAAHHTELAETILDESGYTEMWQARLKSRRTQQSAWKT